MRGLVRRICQTTSSCPTPEIRGQKGQAHVAVVTVVDEEFYQLAAVLRCTHNIPGTAYRVRKLQSDGKYDLVLKQLADRGNIPSASGVKEIIEDFRPHFLLLVGIGGGMIGRDNTAVGDVIVADYVDYYEYAKLVDGQTLIRKMALDHPSQLMRADIAKTIADNGDWINDITLPRPTAGHCKAIVGNLITGDKLLADETNATQRAILETFDKAIVVDMESGGVARAVFSARGSIYYNLQYAIVRGVSDLVDAPNNEEMRREWRAYAAHAAATFAAKIIDEVMKFRY